MSEDVSHWLRSWLFVPATREERFEKALHAGADAVVLDCEDGVRAVDKALARRRARHLLASRATTRSPQLWVRINGLDSPHWLEDVRAVVRPGLEGLRVPKVRGPAQLAQLDVALAHAEREAGLAPGRVAVTCVIECAAGLAAAGTLAAHPRVRYLAFGVADFRAELGPFVPEDGPVVQAAGVALVAAARAAGRPPPMAPPFLGLEDVEGLRRSTEAARAAGFFGRVVLHPSQLAAVHATFRVRPEERAWAREVMDAWTRAEAAGHGSTRVAGQFIGPPSVRTARLLLALADRWPDTEGESP